MKLVDKIIYEKNEIRGLLKNNGKILKFDKSKISNDKLKYKLSISCKDCKNYNEGRCKLKVCEYITKNIKKWYFKL